MGGWPTGSPPLGVRPGDRVGLLMANHLEFVPLKFAIARAGAVAIPFNWPTTPTGKVQKFRLAQEARRHVEGTAP